MIYQKPSVEAYRANEHRVYPETLKERLWLAWNVLRSPDKFRICLTLSEGETWFAKNCACANHGTKNLKVIQD